MKKLMLCRQFYAKLCEKYEYLPKDISTASVDVTPSNGVKIFATKHIRSKEQWTDHEPVLHIPMRSTQGVKDFLDYLGEFIPTFRLIRATDAPFVSIRAILIPDEPLVFETGYYVRIEGEDDDS